MSSQALFCASSPSLLVLIVAISMNDICPVGVNSRGYILWHLCPILLLRNTRFLLFMNPNKISSKPVPSVGCPSSDIEKVFFLFYTNYVKAKGGSRNNCFDLVCLPSSFVPDSSCSTEYTTNLNPLTRPQMIFFWQVNQSCKQEI